MLDALPHWFGMAVLCFITGAANYNLVIRGMYFFPDKLGVLAVLVLFLNAFMVIGLGFGVEGAGRNLVYSYVWGMGAGAIWSWKIYRDYINRLKSGSSPPRT